MTDSKKMIPLSELTLLDRFLFDTVMENEDIHKTILQIILGRDIALLTTNREGTEDKPPFTFDSNGRICYG